MMMMMMMMMMMQANYSVTFFLHDAVYLYLRVLNETLTEGHTDFSDGRLIRNMAVGQEFDGNTFHPSLQRPKLETSQFVRELSTRSTVLALG